jgi:hypothetical protein
MKGLVVWVDRVGIEAIKLGISLESYLRSIEQDATFPSETLAQWSFGPAASSLPPSQTQRAVKSELHPFFESAIRDFPPFDQLLLIGPDLTKFHFQSFLSENYPELNRKVVGCETLDHSPGERRA